MCPNSDNPASFSIPTFLTSSIAIVRELVHAMKALQSHLDIGVVTVRFFLCKTSFARSNQGSPKQIIAQVLQPDAVENVGWSHSLSVLCKQLRFRKGCNH